MTDEQLQQLLDKTFDPFAVVEFKVARKTTRFSEDLALSARIVKGRRTVRVKSTPKLPSEKFGPHYEDYKSGKKTADAQTVLGCYFKMYRDIFEEEDPEWAGENCVKPLYNINMMAHAVCDGDFKKLVEFAEELIPLWAEQLRKGSNFPNTRPTIDALFVRRKIWAQRFLLVRRWTS